MDSVSNHKRSVEPVKLAFSRFEPSNETSSQEVDLPIIILHCMFGSRKQWEGLGRQMAKRTGKTVYALDIRNHGDSGRSTTGNFLSMSLDLEHFLSDHGISKCQILGHSMGGRIAMVLALQKPRLVEKLLVQDVSPVSLPKNSLNSSLFIVNILKELMNKIPPGMSLVRAQKFADERLEPRVPFPLIRQMLVDTLEEKDGQIICNVNLDYLSKNAAIDLDLFPKIDAQYSGPVQFLCAANSEYIRNEDEDGIKKYFPNATIKRVKFSADHLMHMEIPAQFLEMVVEFFEDTL